MEVFDAHTHFFSRDFFVGLVQQRAEVNGDTESILNDVAAKTGLTIPGPDPAAHGRRWVEQMDAHGIAQMVTFASLPNEVDAVTAGVAATNGRLVGYALVNPTVPQAPEAIAKLAGRGFKGVLMFPVMHNYAMNDPVLHPALEAIQAHGMVAVVHFGLLQVKLRDVLGLPRPFDLTYGNPLSLQKAANAFPGITFVIPHFGCGFFRETLMLGSQCENVCVDSSSSNGWLATQPEDIDLARVFAKARQNFGPERILYGTDSSTFPRGYRGDLKATQLEAMEKAAFPADDIEAVMGGNIRRILGVGAPVTAS